VGLLSPWFLAGLAALALPVYFHLLRKHKSTPVPFSSLMFFERRQQSSIQHRRLQYLLLFSLRTLLLLLLVLAFAGPYLTTTQAASSGGRKLILVAVDNSFSMRREGLMEDARRQARSIIGGLKPADRAQVISFNRQVSLLGDPTSDQAALRAAIESIRPGDSRSSLGDLVRALGSVARSAGGPVEVHVISDLQKTSMPSGFAELALPAGVTLTPHPVEAGKISNWAVESVVAPARVDDRGKAKVTATIAGFHTEAAEIRASLLINGKVVESKTAAVPAGGRAALNFGPVDVPHGANRCEVRIDGVDSFAADDRFLFAVERSDPARILLVHEGRDTRSPNYFRTALEAASEATFKLETRTPQEVSAVSPSSFGFVVLANVSSLPKDFEDALERYVREGGGLLVAVGPSAAAHGRVPVAGGAIQESRYASRQGERFLLVDWVDGAHPSIESANRWEGVKFYQVFRTEIEGARLLVRLSDQTPVFLEKPVGEGRVLVLASTLDNISNDFPLHTSFVPFVEKMARYLTGLDETPGSLTVDTFYPLRRVGGRGGVAEVFDPQGRRLLDLAQTTSAPGFVVAGEGFYEVRRSNGRRELIAANADRRESDFEMIAADTLKLWQSTGESSAQGGGAGQSETQRRPLWWPVLLMALLAALAESVVAARYLTVSKEGA